MATHRPAYFPDRPYVDPNPISAVSQQPEIDELGVTSAPLKSAAFFIGQHCKDVNDDFMLCKAENRDPEHCLKEGRKVTRCAQEMVTKLRESCHETWLRHAECLEKNNQYLSTCRKQERAFNECVFEKLGLKKVIPGAPEGEVPVHERKRQIFSGVQK